MNLYWFRINMSLKINLTCYKANGPKNQCASLQLYHVYSPYSYAQFNYIITTSHHNWLPHWLFAKNVGTNQNFSNNYSEALLGFWAWLISLYLQTKLHLGNRDAYIYGYVLNRLAARKFWERKVMYEQFQST